MNQKQTGKFIAELRRERGLTQKELADKLLLSDKTVSKWEQGRGLPEISLLLPLCDELGITVNELLSGKRLSDSEYKKNAEQNMVELMKQKNEFRLRYWLGMLILFITIISAITLFALADYVDMPTALKVSLIILGFAIILIGAIIVIVWERMVFDFKCSRCNGHFVPKVGAYLIGMHTWTQRYLKCPICGKRNWCRLVTKGNSNPNEGAEKPQE